MRFTFILLGILTLPVSAMASEISGAFGFNLGQKISLTSGQADKDGRNYLTPPKEVNAFTDYYVKVVQSTSEISEIGASGVYRSYDECINMHYRLKMGLKNKYFKKKDEGNILDTLTDITKKVTDPILGDLLGKTEWNEDKYGQLIFLKNGKQIDLTCHNKELVIIYSDLKLKHKAKQESESNKSRAIGIDNL